MYASWCQIWYNKLHMGLTSFDRVTLKCILASRVGMNVIRPTSTSEKSLVSHVRQVYADAFAAPAFA